MKGVLYVCLSVLLAGAVLAEDPTCGPDDDFLPHPTDCNLYYACTGGLPVLNNCPEGLWWNTLTDGCDWPANVNCAAGSSSTSTGSTGTTNSSTDTTSTTSSGTSTGTTGTGTIPTEPTDTTGTGTGTIPTEPTNSTITTVTTTVSSTTLDLSTEPPGGLPQSCPAIDDPNEIVRLPHESVCEYYYLCKNGTAVTYSCSNGEQFSPIKRICRSPEAAGCDRCPTILDTPTQITRLPHEDCHLYYLCSADEPAVVFQCRDDWHFSRSVRECLPQEDAKCQA